MGSAAQDSHDAVSVRSRYDLMVATVGSPEVRVVEAAGSVDLLTVAELADHLSAALAEETALIVVVDLRRVEFLSAAGLRVLMAADQRARDQDTALRVLAGSPAVARALSITGLDKTLKIHLGLNESPEPISGQILLTDRGGSEFGSGDGRRGIL